MVGCTAEPAVHLRRQQELLVCWTARKAAVACRNSGPEMVAVPPPVAGMVQLVPVEEQSTHQTAVLGRIGCLPALSASELVAQSVPEPERVGKTG